MTSTSLSPAAAAEEIRNVLAGEREELRHDIHRRLHSAHPVIVIVGTQRRPRWMRAATRNGRFTFRDEAHRQGYDPE